MTSFQIPDRIIETQWESNALHALQEFIALPCLSVDFDKDWQAHGLLTKALTDAKRFGESLFPGARFEVHESKDRAPCLFFDIPASNSTQQESVLFYGHLDKQPAASGWTPPREAFKACREGNKLYGRGGADDGYSVYAALTILHAMHQSGIGNPHAYGLFETAEESGSPGLAQWIELLRPNMRDIGLIAVLDSGAGDYERLWDTVSFRGVLSMTLRVSVLGHGVHSGLASGLIPDTFRIARSLLSRIENQDTGAMLLPELQSQVPAQRLRELQSTAEILGPAAAGFPLLPGVRVLRDDLTEAMVERTWKPQLTVTGAAGLPDIAVAGNVLRAQTALRLSVRLPPCTCAKTAMAAISRALTTEVPYQANVWLGDLNCAPGWNSPEKKPWLAKSLQDASVELFGKSVESIAEGGSIGIMDDFAKAFPNAQFLVTGILGPNANAHGPDECLRLDYLKKLSRALVRVLAAMP